tara:strand:- start:422 stop:949 length:528 start_codon:yes stop_codon:yes gene_type:complete
MTSYVAPHLRNNKKNIIKEEFPELTNISKKNNKIQNLKKSFAEIALEKERKEEIDSLDEVKPGWSIIKKDSKSKIVILDSKKTIERKESLRLDKEVEECKECLKNYDKMINNWNNFRDTENELYGDLSAYYYYKEELEKMKEENLLYEQKAEEFYLDNQNNSDTEDDESNKYLIY